MPPKWKVSRCWQCCKRPSRSCHPSAMTTAACTHLVQAWAGPPSAFEHADIGGVVRAQVKMPMMCRHECVCTRRMRNKKDEEGEWKGSATGSEEQACKAAVNGMDGWGCGGCSTRLRQITSLVLCGTERREFWDTHAGRIEAQRNIIGKCACRQLKGDNTGVPW